MARSGQFTNSLRYLKSRLRTLKKRPMVWSSAAAVVMVSTVFLAYYLSNANRDSRNTYQANPTGVASLDTLPSDPSTSPFGTLPSAEDSAIGADIDNLPLLLQQLDGSGQGALPNATGQPTNLPSVPTLSPNPLVTGNDSLVSPNRSGSDRQTTVTVPRTDASRSSFNYEVPEMPTPGNATPSGNGTGSSFNVDSSSSSFSSTPNLPNSTSTTITSPSSPLQSAIERNSGSSSPSYLPPTSGGFANGSSDRPPQTAPSPGTTGYMLPQSLQPRQNSSSNPATGASPNTTSTVNPYQSQSGMQTTPQINTGTSQSVSQPSAGFGTQGGYSSGFGTSPSGQP